MGILNQHFYLHRVGSDFARALHAMMSAMITPRKYDSVQTETAIHTTVCTCIIVVAGVRAEKNKKRSFVLCHAPYK